MSQIVEEAKAEYSRAQGRLIKALERTQADKLNWSPSSTARTPIQLAAHAAMGTSGICSMLKGEPFPFASMLDMDAKLREMEKQYTNVDQVKALIDTNSTAYFTWLDTLTDEQVAGTAQLPMGAFPMAGAITFAADHVRGHVSQIEYIQTIYGDHDSGF